MAKADSESAKETEEPKASSKEDSPTEEQLGEVLKEAKVISEEDLGEVLEQKEKGGGTFMDLLRKKVTWQNLKDAANYTVHRGAKETTVGDVLVKAKLMTPPQLAEARSRPRLAEALLARGLLTEEQLEKAEKTADETGHPLWRTLINLGMVREKVIGEVLRTQAEKIGELLHREGRISKQQLQTALDRHEQSGEKTGMILVSMGALTEEGLAKALAEQAGMPFVDLEAEEVDYGAAIMLPSSVIQQFHCLPIKEEDGVLTVVTEDINRISALLDVGMMLGVEVQPAVAPKSQVETAIDKYLSWRKVQTGLAPPEEPPTGLQMSELLAMRDLLDRASVPRLVTSMIERAIKSRATDIHFDPQDTGLRVRYRIDGMLHDVITLPPQISSGVITRLKILANMDISERRLPQDGHIHVEIGAKEYDMRVASVRTSLGEKLVLRLLVEENVITGLAQLGLDPDQREQLEALIRKPYGLLLATGPVGSGKTTTLYCCLNQVNILTKNVTTIEDPIEYKLRGTNQLEVNPRIDFDFADGLRALLRQDPDVMMVGEIRDDETARITIRAAMTGVLAFSTLHANDSASSIMALVHQGVPRFLISSAVIGIVSQRLVRKVCEHCKEDYKPPLEVCLEMGMPRDEAEEFVGKRGAGCAECFYTGYLGRTGIFEIMTINDELADLILKQSGRDEIRRAAIASGMRTLAESALDKVRAGITTPEQLFATVFV